MRLTKALFLSVTLVVFMASAGWSQICGDVNNDSTLNILDVVMSLDHISGITPPEFVPANADCDGVTGITIADVVALSDEFFSGFGTLNCSVTGSYGFLPAANDTIYIPRLLNIPDSVNQVSLLVFASLSSEVEGIYVPTTELGTFTNGTFELSSSHIASQPIVGVNRPAADTTVVFAYNMLHQPGFLTDYQNLVLFQFSRVSSGSGNIDLEATALDPVLQPAIERSADLYTPVIAYYDAKAPAGGFELSATNLSFNALIDEPAVEVEQVELGFNGLHVGFELTASEPWIVIDQNTGVTPATVTITADAAGLGVLNYNGVVRIEYKDLHQQADSIVVSLTVHPADNQQFPAGDINCDGSLNIEDLVYLVDYFFRGGTQPFPCQ